MSFGAPLETPALGRVNIYSESFRDKQNKNLVRQRLDYSCGAAALATLLTYELDDPAGELEIVRLLLLQLTLEERTLREKRGFSLLDLKRAAEARGHMAQGFWLKPEDLPRLKGPVIVFIRPRGYEHFAVLNGVVGDRVHLADPARGNLRLPALRFLESWLHEDGRGIVFAVQRRDGVLREGRPLLPSGSRVRPELMSVRQMLLARPSGHVLSLP